MTAPAAGREPAANPVTSPRSEASVARSSALGVLAVGALAGACTMTIELAAVRLLAPWFGTSSAVWTNVIAVILLALSLGYLFGAKWSRGARTESKLGACLLAAAAATAWLPAMTGPVASFFLPAGLGLAEAARLLSWGSLACAIVLFLPSTVLLGCVPPLVTEIVARRDHRGAGDAGGRVLAASTLGSIAGTFATTYWTLPRLGLSTTFLAAGALLAALGAIVLARGGVRRSAPAVAALLLVGVAFAASRLAKPAPGPDQVVLAAGESAYQSVRVVETTDAGTPMRLLQVNEGFDSFQSVWTPANGLLPPGFYYNLFALPAWWSEAGARWRVLVVGLGGGTAWRVLEGALPAGVELDAVGVEIDPLVVALARRWMELPPEGPRRTALGDWDGRAALRALPGGFDQIVLDAYANQMEIPAHLSTLEFFLEAREKLAAGGWLAVNVGAFGLEDPVVTALGGTVARAFGRRALVVRVPFSRNCVLFARRDAEPDEVGSARWKSGTEAIGRLQEALALPGASRWFEPAGDAVLTDDLNPIDALQRRSIGEGLARAAGSL